MRVFRGAFALAVTNPPVEGLLAQRLTRPETVDVATLRAEYQVAVDFIKVLTDIRFRCLAFVTATAAVANALLPGTGRPGLRIALGSLGFFTTVGIAVYELRNSQLYEAAIHRAKMLERRLRGDSSDAKDEGLFNERPIYVRRTAAAAAADEKKNKKEKKTLMRFWLVPVKHDHGLALIYGAVLGAWAYLFVDGVLSVPAPAGLWEPKSVERIQLIAGAVAVLVAGLSVWQVIHHDRKRLRPG
jgi:hypothetical protein